MKLTVASHQVILGSKVPLFARGEERHANLTVYLDQDGMWASCNFKPVSNFRPCCLCGNHCITFAVDTDGSYTCSACGKFPPEILQRGIQ